MRAINYTGRRPLVRPTMKPSDYQAQKGSVLLVALMVLIVLTLLTFSSSKSVILQEKMTASARDGILALEVAEAALIEAESIINIATTVFEPEGSAKGLYDGSDCKNDTAQCAYIDDLKNVFDDNTWKKSTKASKGVNCGNGDANCRRNGDYIIVKLGKVDLTLSTQGDVDNLSETNQAVTWGDVNKYKIIARGTGVNPNTQRILVSYYAAQKTN